MDVKILYYPYQITGNDNQDDAASVNTEVGDDVKPHKYTLSLDDKNLTLSVTTLFNGQKINCSIDIDLALYNHKAFEVMLKENNQNVGLDAYEIMSYVDRDTGLKNAAYNGEKVVRGYAEDDTVVLLLLKNSEPIEGFENEVMDRSKTSTGWLLSKCPRLAERYQKFKKKAAMLNDVDLYRSVAYLEAQVDLLTSVLLKITTEQDMEELLVLAAAQENSVLKIKPAEDLLLEFNENKKHIREIQEAYYERLHV